MSRSPQTTAHLDRGRVAWLNRSVSMESLVERTLTWFEVLGYTVLLQSDIVSGRHQSILQQYHRGVLRDRFWATMQRINPTATPQQIEFLLRQCMAPRPLPILQQNRQWHWQLLNGISLGGTDWEPPGTTLRLLDFSNLWQNDWLVIHSFPVIESDYQHCLDLVIFINGLPLAVFHGLQGGEAPWSLRASYLQLQHYQTNLPQFFALNELLVLSNGHQSRVGTLTTSWKQFSPIVSANGEKVPLAGETEAETLIQGLFDKRRFFEILQHSIVFRQSRTKLIKKFQHRSFCTVSMSRSRR